MKLKNSVLIFKAITSITSKLFNLFIPLIIYGVTKDIFTAILFLLVSISFRILILFLFRKWQTKYPDMLLFLRFFPLTILQVLITAFGNYGFGLIMVMGLLSGFQSGLEWPSINNLFVLSTDKDKVKNVSVFNTMSSIGSIIAPFIGALLISLNLEVYSFLICIIFNLIASVLIISSHKEVVEKITFLPDSKETKSFDDKNFYMFYCFKGLQDFAVDQILPIFLAINSISVNIIGLAYSLYQLCVVVANFITIPISKSKSWYLCSSIACVLASVLMLVLVIIPNTITAITFTLGLGILFPIMYNLMFAKIINREDKKVLYLMTDRDICVIAPKLIPCVFALFCPLVIPMLIGGLSYGANIYCYSRQWKKEMRE